MSASGVKLACNDDMSALLRYKTPHANITMTPQATKDEDSKVSEFSVSKNFH